MPTCHDLTCKQFYWPEANVIVTRFLAPHGAADLTDFMPAGRAVFRSRLTLLDSAETLGDLAALPSNRLEALRGDRDGQHSIMGRVLPDRLPDRQAGAPATVCSRTRRGFPSAITDTAAIVSLFGSGVCPVTFPCWATLFSSRSLSLPATTRASPP